MSENIQELVATNESDNQNTEASRDEVSELRAEVERLKTHTQTLLSEKKAEQEKKKLAEQEAEKERLDKLAKQGNYQELLTTKEQEAESWKQKYEDLTNKQKEMQVKSLTNEVALECFQNPLLGKLISDCFTYSEELEKPIFKYNGNAYATKQEMIEAIKGSQEFKPFVVIQSSNGGGSTGSTAQPKIDTTKMSLTELMTHTKQQGK